MFMFSIYRFCLFDHSKRTFSAFPMSVVYINNCFSRYFISYFSFNSSIMISFSRIEKSVIITFMASADDPSICFAEAQIKHIYTDNNLKLRLKAPEEFYQKIDQAAKKYPNYFSKE